MNAHMHTYIATCIAYAQTHIQIYINYAFVHTYIHTYRYKNTHVRTSLYTCIHTHICIRMYVCICMYVYVCNYVRIYMCMYVGLFVYVCICRPMCLYVCAYMYACMYVYVCTVYMYVCICVIIINSHGLSARRCPMPVSSTASNFLCPTPSVHICVVCIIHVYVLGEMSDGTMSYSKREEELSGGELSGGIIVLYTPIVDCQTSDLCQLQQNPHAFMDDRSSLDLEAEHGVTMNDMLASPWMTCIVEVQFQNTCRCDTRGEKKHMRSTTETDRSHKRREYFVGLFTLHEEEILNALRARMGNQCSSFSVGVMWSFIILAAVCGTEDKG